MNELNVHTIGGVVAPAEVLVTIVPIDPPLPVDIRLSPWTIEQVHQDQVARLRFPAFKHRVTPELIGHVIHVAPATSVDRGTEQSYDQGTMAIAPEELGRLGDKALLDGMPVEVYIATEERTVASYMIKPITDRFSMPCVRDKSLKSCLVPPFRTFLPV